MLMNISLSLLYPQTSNMTSLRSLSIFDFVVLVSLLVPVKVQIRCQMLTKTGRAG